jgi:cyanate permease
MAIGGWIAGALYDRFGTYMLAFAAGVGANAVNLAIVGMLVLRQRHLAARKPIP